MNRVKVVLSGFSMRLFGLSRYIYINYIFPERLMKMLFKYITFIHINIMYIFFHN